MKTVFCRSFFLKLMMCVVLCLGIAQVQAQKKATLPAYKITLNIDSLTGKWLRMGYYYSNAAYLLDSQRVEKNKKIYVFQGNKKLPEGLYFFTFADGIVLDFIMDKAQNFVINTEYAYLKDRVFVENSVENEQYFEYVRYLNPQEQDLQAINIQMQNAKTGNNTQIVAVLEPKKQKIIAEVNNYIRGYIKIYPDNLQTKIMVAGKNVVVPDSIPYMVDKKLNYFYYKYTYDHYWDSYDFDDARLLHTKVFDKKLTNYFDQIIPKNADSSVVCLNRLLQKLTKHDPKVYNATVLWLVNHYDKIDVMGYDAIYIYIAQNYLSAEKAPWLSVADRERLNYKVKIYQNTLLGNEIPAIALVDVQNQPFDIKNIDADYTFVIFYSPKCSHCIEEMPKFYELYQKYKTRNIAMVAINIDKEEGKQWADFVKEKGWQWYNVMPAATEKQFQENFAAYNLPVPYMLGRDKKIVMKRLQPQQFDKHLSEMVAP